MHHSHTLELLGNPITAKREQSVSETECLLTDGPNYYSSYLAYISKKQKLNDIILN